MAGKKNKVGRPRLFNSPEEMWQFFLTYKNLHEEISIKGFEKFADDIIGNIERYLNKPYLESFEDVILNIKESIFENKLALYKKGKICHSKVIRELKERGLDGTGLSKNKLHKNILKDVEKNQFEIENGLLTVSNSYLKKKRHSAVHLMNKTTPDTIYVLNINGTNLYKIGVSINHKRRIDDIRAVIPFSVDVILVKKSLFAYDLEQSIHEFYKEYHVKNEWFKITNPKELLKMINK